MNVGDEVIYGLGKFTITGIDGNKVTIESVAGEMTVNRHEIEDNLIGGD